MRIRKAALAGATALAVAFSGTSVATAQDAPAKTSLSSQFNEPTQGDVAADGTKLFGQETEVSSQPKWAQILYGVGIASAVVTVLGLLVGPALNFIKYGPVDFDFKF